MEALLTEGSDEAFLKLLSAVGGVVFRPQDAVPGRRGGRRIVTGSTCRQAATAENRAPYLTAVPEIRCHLLLGWVARKGQGVRMGDSLLSPLAADLVVVLRFVIGVTLLAASFPKLKNPAKFALGVMQYKVLPTQLARAYGLLLPLCEVLAGSMLILGGWVRVVSSASAIMFGSFGFGVLVNLLRKKEMPCYCFGTSESLGWNTLTRICILLGLSMVLALIAPGEGGGLSLSVQAVPTDLPSLAPLLFLTLFGLVMLEFVRISPSVIRAWTARPRVVHQGGQSVVWTREASEDGK